jgi:hypothetical protein
LSPTNYCSVGAIISAEKSVHKKALEIKGLIVFLAERVGFEPTVGYKPTAVFKTAAINRSATSP